MIGRALRRHWGLSMQPELRLASARSVRVFSSLLVRFLWGFVLHGMRSALSNDCGARCCGGEMRRCGVRTRQVAVNERSVATLAQLAESVQAGLGEPTAPVPLSGFYTLVNGTTDTLVVRQHGSTERIALAPGARHVYTWCMRGDLPDDRRALQVALARVHPLDEDWSAPFAIDGVSAFVRRPVPPPDVAVPAVDGVGGMAASAAQQRRRHRPVQLTADIQGPSTGEPSGRVKVTFSSWFAVTNRTGHPLHFSFVPPAAATEAIANSSRSSSWLSEGDDTLTGVLAWNVPPGQTVALPTPVPLYGPELDARSLPVPNLFSLRWPGDGRSSAGVTAPLVVLDPANAAAGR